MSSSPDSKDTDLQMLELHIGPIALSLQVPAGKKDQIQQAVQELNREIQRYMQQYKMDGHRALAFLTLNLFLERKDLVQSLEECRQFALSIFEDLRQIVDEEE